MDSRMQDVSMVNPGLFVRFHTIPFLLVILDPSYIGQSGNFRTIAASCLASKVVVSKACCTDSDLEVNHHCHSCFPRAILYLKSS